MDTGIFIKNSENMGKRTASLSNNESQTGIGHADKCKYIHTRHGSKKCNFKLIKPYKT